MIYYVYITTNTAKNVFYTGITNDLNRRMKEHRESRSVWKHFAGRYFCHKLIYYEMYESIADAIAREKEIKDMSREKKIALIKSKNSNMVFYNVWKPDSVGIL